MAPFALQTDYGPVFFSLFQVFEPEADHLVTTQTAGKQHRKQCSISFVLNTVTVRSLPQREALVCGEPVPQPHAKIRNASDATDPRGKVGTQKPAICGLISQPAHRPKRRINGPGREQARFEVAAISQDNCSV